MATHRSCAVVKASDWLTTGGRGVDVDALLAVVADTSVSSRVAARDITARFGVTVPHNSINDHRAGLCRRCAPRSVETILAPSGGWTADAKKVVPRPVDSPRFPKAKDPEITYGKEGRPVSLTSIPIPDGVHEEDATVLARTLALFDALPIQPGHHWVAVAGRQVMMWHRDTEGEDATTRPARQVEFKALPIPVEDANVWSEDDWDAQRKSIVKVVVGPLARRSRPRDPHLLFVPIGDLQAGQGDGDGIDGLIARFALIPDNVKSELTRLEAGGTKVTGLVVPALGDLVENIIGFYAGQTWAVSLNRRQQCNIARRIIRDLLIDLAAFGLPIEVPVVPGNHGENRNAGHEILTDWSDNDDVAVMEQVADIMDMHPVLRKQIRFAFPAPNRMTLTRDYFGRMVGFAHGHTAKTSGDPVTKIKAWFKSQKVADQPIGYVDILVTGHYHHPIYMALFAGVSWVQIPACCDSSDHFVQTYGLDGNPGHTTFTVSAKGIDHYRVHELPRLGDASAGRVPRLAAAC